jgi:hypothetical protein
MNMNDNRHLQARIDRINRITCNCAVTVIVAVVILAAILSSVSAH